MNSFECIPARDRVIVAIDTDYDDAFQLAFKLTGHARWVKIGMMLFYAHGPAVVSTFKERGFDVFLDLKFHDIPHQVEGAAASATASGADMITMHASGGCDMMRAAQRGAEAAAAELGLAVPATLGITVLTSMVDADLERINVGKPVSEQVVDLANLTREAGISGVVASPWEATTLRRELGPDAFIVTPGVRPYGADCQDQSRVSTPKEAFLAGASHIVVGRPITRAEDPAAAFEDLVKGL